MFFFFHINDAIESKFGIKNAIKFASACNDYIQLDTTNCNEKNRPKIAFGIAYLVSFIKRLVCKKSCLAQLLFIERYKKWIAKIQLSYRVHGIMRTVFNVEIITHKFLFVNFCFNFIIINNLQMKQNMFLIFLLLRLDYDFFKELFLGRAGEMFQFDCNI